MATVVTAALEVARESHGAQDITVEPLVRLWGFLGGPRRVPTHLDEVCALMASTLARLRPLNVATSYGIAAIGWLQS